MKDRPVSFYCSVCVDSLYCLIVSRILSGRRRYRRTQRFEFNDRPHLHGSNRLRIITCIYRSRFIERWNESSNGLPGHCVEYFQQPPLFTLRDASFPRVPLHAPSRSSFICAPLSLKLERKLKGAICIISCV